MSSILFRFTLVIFLYLSYSCNTSTSGHSLPPVHFDSIYTDVFIRVAANNNDSAFYLAHLLLKSADTEIRKIKSHMLLATLYERKDDAINAINFAKQGYTYAKKARNNDWLLRINGFLSTAYRQVGLYDYGKEYLHEAIQLVETFNSPLLSSFILQEKSFYSIEEKNYELALNDLKKSTELMGDLKQSPQLNAYFWALNAQLLGVCYNSLNQYDTARQYFLLSLDSLGNTESELQGFNYAGLAKASIQLNELQEACHYLMKAEPYMLNSQNFRLQSILCHAFVDYYSKTGNETLALRYQKEYISIRTKEVESVKLVMKQIVDGRNNILTDTRQYFRFTAFISTVIITAISILLIAIYLRNKKEKRIYRNIIRQLVEDRNFILNKHLLDAPQPFIPPLPADGPPEDISEDPIPEVAVPPESDEPHVHSQSTAKTERRVNIPRENLDKLLEKLDNFEQGTLYLNPEISQSMLAVQLQTNAKYLSFVINEYRKLDFNNYINRLRITYIVNKLKNEPNYLCFKIAALAEECGFSSHSKFTAVFKQLLGLSPSDFIKQLKEDNP